MQIEPRYKHVCIDREAVTIKCWLVPTGGPGDGDTVTLWELRRVLNTIWGAAVDTCKFLRHHKAEIHDAMSHAGLEAEQELVPSFKAWRARNGDAAPPAYAQEEYQITSEGLVALVAAWCQSRRLDRHKDKCRQVLAELFRCACPQSTQSDRLLSTADEAVLRECPDFRAGDRACGHYLRVYEIIGGSTEEPHVALARLAELLAAEAAKCPATARWWSEWLPLCVATFPELVVDWEQNPLVAKPESLVGHGQKRRRIDVDLKIAVSTTAMEQHLAKTPGAYMVASGGAPRSTASSWTPVVLGQYRAGCMLSFRDKDILSVAYDCSRLGQPKEETMMCALSEPLGGRAAWMPPQAIVSTIDALASVCRSLHRGVAFGWGWGQGLAPSPADDSCYRGPSRGNYRVIVRTLVSGRSPGPE